MPLLDVQDLGNLPFWILFLVTSKILSWNCNLSVNYNSHECFRTRGYQGTININGKQRKREAFLKESSYIMQDDHLQPYLTVYESMEISSKLKNCVTKLDVYQQVLVSQVFFYLI